MKKISVPRNMRSSERLLSFLPWCKEWELSGYLGKSGILYEVGGKRESRAFNKEVVFHSHPKSKNANVPSPADVMKFAYLSRAKVSIVVCPDCFVVMAKGPRFNPEKYNPEFDAVSLMWNSGKIDGRWIKNWKRAVVDLGMKVDLYGRESA